MRLQYLRNSRIIARIYNISIVNSARTLRLCAKTKVLRTTTTEKKKNKNKKKLSKIEINDRRFICVSIRSLALSISSTSASLLPSTTAYVHKNSNPKPSEFIVIEEFAATNRIYSTMMLCLMIAWLSSTHKP